ncbi:MAG: cysteine--tRNA ligase [Chloroflexota bacterium]
MPFRLLNTLTRSVDAFEPLEPGRVRMYTCGPTVYRYAHVGNLRSYLLADLIRRALVVRGYDVLHVKNITDVGHLRDERFDRGEDKMLVAARLEDKSPEEIARAYEAAFHEDEALVNILPAHVFPRATEHVPEMVALAERLVDLGCAYEVDGTVYYDVGRFPGYGRLSGNTLDELRAGHRGEVEADKRDPADFALWRRAGEGRMVKWETPRWGEGFPGWHIECSAMAMRYLGDQFDIHTGGIDNVFPHHEDEIAQSQATTGVIPARWWVHGEHLLMSGRKMAKSAGNFQRITDLAAEGHDPLAFRYLCFTAHYRRKLNFSPESLAGAAAALVSLRARVRSLGPRPAGEIGVGGPEEMSPAARGLHDRWTAAVDDDVDMPTAVAVVREITKATDVPAAERRWLLLDADRVLGLDLERSAAQQAAEERITGGSIDPAGKATGAGAGPGALSALAAEFLRERAAARAARDWARSDALRDDLSALGIEVTDRAGGIQEWRIREG